MIKKKKIKSIETSNNNVNNKRIIAYVPNFSKILANIIEPGVGASTCASGNQICKGIIGTFTPKPKNNKRTIIIFLLDE